MEPKSSTQSQKPTNRPHPEPAPFSSYIHNILQLRSHFDISSNMDPHRGCLFLRHLLRVLPIRDPCSTYINLTNSTLSHRGTQMWVPVVWLNFLLWDPIFEGSSVQNLFHVTVMEPRILKNLGTLCETDELSNSVFCQCLISSTVLLLYQYSLYFVLTLLFTHKSNSGYCPGSQA